MKMSDEPGKKGKKNTIQFLFFLYFDFFVSKNGSFEYLLIFMCKV